MTSTFEGQPPKAGLFQSKQGSFACQVYKYIGEAKDGGDFELHRDIPMLNEA